MEGIVVRPLSRSAFVGESKADLVIGEFGHQFPQPLANEGDPMAFGTRRIDEAACAPVDLHGRGRERMGRLVTCGIR